MTFSIDEYRITLYGEANTLVLLNENSNEGCEVWSLLSENTRKKITLACISGICWEWDLTPWEAPAAFKGGAPFSGGADAYLEKVTKTLIPEIQRRTQIAYDGVYIAGYSLAGLFAVYGAIKTNDFDGLISASGSMWYPGFLDFVKNQTLTSNVKTAYFSIGDKEDKTKNPVMQSVLENTRAIEGMMAARGVKTRFELNPGGHFKDDGKRLAKGVEWVIGNTTVSKRG